MHSEIVNKPLITSVFTNDSKKGVQLSRSFEIENFSALHGWIENLKKNKQSLTTCGFSGKSKRNCDKTGF